MTKIAQAREATDLPSTPRAAVTMLFHLHYRRLVGLAALMVDDRETAEEVAQDAFEALYRHWSQLRDPGAAVEYLNRSVVNGSRSRLRRRLVQLRHDPPEAGVAQSAETIQVERSAQQALVAAIRALPRRQREVVVLRYFLDLSEEQIADWLGVSKGSVKTHTSRAVAALHTQLEGWA